MNLRLSFLTLLFIAYPSSILHAQQTFSVLHAPIEKVLNSYTKGITMPAVHIDSVQLQHDTLSIFAPLHLAYIPFTEANCKHIYEKIRTTLPAAYQQYPLAIYAGKNEITHLIPRFYQQKKNKSKTFTYAPFTPLVKNQDRPYTIIHGLEGKHIAMWQSHGLYFEAGRNRWQWQRARMLQTVEDKYTQQYVLPYLIPMLENAGAYVLTPRERDVNPFEVIVDNDGGVAQKDYTETTGAQPWTTGKAPGFAYLRPQYRDFENPFHEGTYRVATTTHNKKAVSSICWRPNIPQSRDYAVYVAYQSLPNSATDAHYTIHHSGGTTTLLVNQSMGGGTWIYLGTFPFQQGKTAKVVLTNYSKQNNSVITADALRLGGGLGNIARTTNGDSIAYDGKIDRQIGRKPRNAYQPAMVYPYQVSGYPRYLEAARYSMQWAGVPDSIYSPSHGLDDYRDDYKSRGQWVNYLAAGTKAWPEGKGLNIPIDLSFAFHSDAGTVYGDSIIGTLGIYDTQTYNGHFADGSSRQANRDLCDLVQSSIVHDIRTCFEPKWSRRGMWDQRYFEAWTPRVPAMLLELLSHENFADMRYGHDPRFQFAVSRAIYKGILRFLSDSYGYNYVVQPLPVHHFSTQLLKNNRVLLQWEATPDSLEPTATAKHYVVYQRIGNGGFDNGTVVHKNSFVTEIPTDSIVSFKVCALNDGGISFPSEILSVGIAPHSNAKPILIINAFDRISAPDDFCSSDDEWAGFLAESDNGVPYLQQISFVGKQKEFRRSIPWTDDDASGFGDSQANFERIAIAGNTFDYPRLHGDAILKAGYSFVSAGRDAAIQQGMLDTQRFAAIDIIIGKNKQSKLGRIQPQRELHFKTFPSALQQAITNYCKAGGNLFVSGAYLGTDLWCNPLSASQKEDINFAKDILKYQWRNDKAAITGKFTTVTSPLSADILTLTYASVPNSSVYAVESPDAIEPADSCAYTAFRYPENNKSAGVVFGGNATDHWRSIVLAIPFETIMETPRRTKLMQMILNYLLQPVAF